MHRAHISQLSLPTFMRKKLCGTLCSQIQWKHPSPISVLPAAQSQMGKPGQRVTLGQGHDSELLAATLSFLRKPVAVGGSLSPAKLPQRCKVLQGQQQI